MVKPHSSRRIRRAVAAAAVATAGVLTLATPASAGFSCGVSASNVYVIEGDEGTSVAGFAVTTTGSCPDPTTINYATRNGTATSGTDYTATSGTLTFTNIGTQTVEVSIIGDTTREWTESFFLDLTSDDAVVAPGGGYGEITDEDGASNVLVYDNPAAVDTANSDSAEGDNTQAALAAMGHTVTTTVATTGAQLASDLEGKDAFVIPENLGTGFVGNMDAAGLEVVADFVAAGGTLIKMDEFEVLNSIFGWTIVDSTSAIALLLDTAEGTEFEDNAPSVHTPSATNGVEASSVPVGTIPIYGYSDTLGNAFEGTAATATDLTAFITPVGDGSVVWLGWDWFNSEPGHPVDDNGPGENGGWSAVLDSAVEKPDVSIADVTVTEGDAGTTTTVTVTVTLSDAVSENVSVQLTTVAGTASAGGDYTAKTVTVEIPRGSTSATTSITITNDNSTEQSEAFTVTLSDPVAARIIDDTATVTIVDDDTFGYRMVATDGGIFTFGDNEFWGSTGDKVLNKPIVGGATNPVSTEGYWIVASDGGVFTFGDAAFFGSLGGTPLTSPIVEIEPTITGKGYWLVSAAGQVTPFGDAVSYGDARTIGLNKPVIGMAVAPDGKGYWLVAEDGGIFSFGSATFFGSMGDKKLNAPVIDLAPMPDGKGYYLVARDGGVFTFGSAIFRGSTGSMTLNAPVTAMLVAADGSGYWLGASDGGVFTFGPVPFLGSMGAKKLNAPVLDFIP